jgi:hypothetical protein
MELSIENSKKNALVDDEDYVRCIYHKWSAALAYNEKAIKYHGEFAVLNIFK